MPTAVQKYELAFMWTNAIAGYRWEDCRPCDPWGKPFDEWEEDRKEEFEGLFRPIPDGPYLTEIFPQMRNMPYEPFEDAALFAKFADISPDKESFCQWAHQYGRLIDVEKDLGNFIFIFPEYIPVNETDVEYHRMSRGRYIIERNGRYFHRAKADPLNFWLREHHALSFPFMVWEWALNADPRLEKILEYNEDTRRVYIYTFPKNRLEEIDFARFGEDTSYNPSFVKSPYRLEGYFPDSFNVREAALRYVQERINEKLASWPLRIFFKTDDSGKIHKVIEPTSLLSAMWYQFYLALAGEIRLRRCSLCGKWEDMATHRETWSKHANCANYNRVKKARLKKRGKVDEI
jgi:hypothetical protein